MWNYYSFPGNRKPAFWLAVLVAETGGDPGGGEHTTPTGSILQWA